MAECRRRNRKLRRDEYYRQAEVQAHIHEYNRLPERKEKERERDRLRYEYRRTLGKRFRLQNPTYMRDYKRAITAAFESMNYAGAMRRLTTLLSETVSMNHELTKYTKMATPDLLRELHSLYDLSRQNVMRMGQIVLVLQNRGALANADLPPALRRRLSYLLLVGSGELLPEAVELCAGSGKSSLLDQIKKLSPDEQRRAIEAAVLPVVTVNAETGKVQVGKANIVDMNREQLALVIDAETGKLRDANAQKELLAAGPRKGKSPAPAKPEAVPIARHYTLDYEHGGLVHQGELLTEDMMAEALRNLAKWRRTGKAS